MSLDEGVPRRALVFRVELDRQGEVRDVRLERARIRSRKQLTYRGVQRFWDGDESLAQTEYAPSLAALRVVGRRRQALAEARNVVRYQRVELAISVSESGGFVAFEVPRYESDRCNEQISRLVNVEGARLLAARRGSDSALQAIFRVHPAPAEADLAAFERMTRALADRHQLPALAWRAAHEPLAVFLDRLASSTVIPSGVVLALQRQALLLNQRSAFAAEPGPHFGIGAPCYARFSSPMREVVGIFTHKEALELLGLVRPDRGDDETLRAAVIDAANRAKDVQQRLTKAGNQIVIAAMLGADLELPEDVRPRRAGVVVGLAPDKAYVVLDATKRSAPLELKVYARDLGARAQLSVNATTLTIERPGTSPITLVLGQRLTVVTRAHDPARDRFVIVPELTPAASARPPA